MDSSQENKEAIQAIQSDHKYRAEGDLRLAKVLLKEPAVRRVINKIEEIEKEGPRGTRKQLLATSLRILPSMSEVLNRVTTDCLKIVDLDIPLEIYVYNSPQFNAACFKPDAGKLFIMFSSSLLQGFNEDELKFVLGHELGHYLFGHHDLPIGYLVKGPEKINPKLALQLFAWSRYAEISADRMGAACAQNKDAVASALFKLSSGITSDIIKISAEEFMSQADDMQEELKNTEIRSNPNDWFSTHPFSPLRLKALKYFFDSEIYNQDKNNKGKNSIEILEGQVQTVLALMEPSYLDDKSDVSEEMRRLLFACAITLFNLDNTIDEKEIESFEKIFGPDSLNEDLSLERIEKDLTRRITNAKTNIPYPKRIQVLRDLFKIAAGGNGLGKKGLNFIKKITADLDLSNTIINQLHEESLILD